MTLQQIESGLLHMVLAVLSVHFLELVFLFWHKILVTQRYCPSCEALPSRLLGSFWVEAIILSNGALFLAVL